MNALIIVAGAVLIFWAGYALYASYVFGFCGLI